MFIIIKSSRCSLVFDRISQKSPQLQNYCPKTKYCKEGTHVMCMYYDPNNEMGPGCYNFVNTRMTPRLTSRIVDIVNQIRIRVSTGNETGFNNEPFPKAYGMKRMSWDDELAIFAQVLANQCFGGREDICRSTDKFPSPSQGSAIVQFRYPDWGYLVNDTKDIYEGLGEDKLEFAIDRFFRATYDLRRTVTRDMVVRCPEIHKLPNMKSRFYLNLIRGPATHIGCGISAYTRYNSNYAGKSSYYNAVEIICNFSDSPQPTQPIYMVDPPIPDTGFSPNCGCPKLYKETSGCLCEENPISYEWISSPGNPTRPPGVPKEVHENTQIHKTGFLPNHQVGMGQPQPIKNVQQKPNPDLDPTVKLIPPKRPPIQPKKPIPKPMWKSPTKLIPIPKRTTSKPICNDPFGNCDKESVLLPIFSGDENYGTLNYLRTPNGSILIPASRTPDVAEITDFRENLILEIPQMASENVKSYETLEVKNNQNNLMTLLDKLEIEVKRNSFDTNTQEIFDLKMRSIYGNAQKNYKTQKPTMNIDNQFGNVLKNYMKPKLNADNILRKGVGLKIPDASTSTMENKIRENIKHNENEKVLEKILEARKNGVDQQSTNNDSQLSENQPTKLQMDNPINIKGQITENEPTQNTQQLDISNEEEIQLSKNVQTAPTENDEKDAKEVQTTSQVPDCVNIQGQLIENHPTPLQMVNGNDKSEKQLTNRASSHKEENDEELKNNDTDKNLVTDNGPTLFKEDSDKEKESNEDQSLIQDEILLHCYNDTSGRQSTNDNLNHKNDNFNKQEYQNIPQPRKQQTAPQFDNTASAEIINSEDNLEVSLLDRFEDMVTKNDDTESEVVVSRRSNPKDRLNKDKFKLFKVNDYDKKTCESQVFIRLFKIRLQSYQKLFPVITIHC